jgi:nicotinate-nucleotide--dimethylbenzimidazole phosphoribosyltransferase
METLSALLAAIPQPDVASPGRPASCTARLSRRPRLPGGFNRPSICCCARAMPDKAIVVMCADHGVWHEGVTPSPQAVTAIHAGNMADIPATAGHLEVDQARKRLGVDADIHHLHSHPCP